MVSTAISPGVLAQGTAIRTQFVNRQAPGAVALTQRIAVIGQGAAAVTYPSTRNDLLVTPTQVGETYGFGTPLHLASLLLQPPQGGGAEGLPVTYYPVQADGGATTAEGDITPSGTPTRSASYRVKAGGIFSDFFTIAVGDVVADMVTAMAAAVNAVSAIPVIASDDTTDVGIAAKWAGESGNDIVLQVEGPTDAGVSFGFTQPTGGATDPDIAPALAEIGNVWETVIVNCFSSTNTAILDALVTENETRWLPENSRPFVAFAGSTPADTTAAVAVTDSRTLDRTNCVVPLSASPNELPCRIAAKCAANVAITASRDPALDFGGLSLGGLTPGAENAQWSQNERDFVIKGGASTTEVRDNVPVSLSLVTPYKRTGEDPPGYRYVKDITRVQNLINGLRALYSGPKWEGVPIIPDGQRTTNANARTPKQAESDGRALVQQWGLNAWISDPDSAVIVAGIDGANPNRINVSVSVNLSGNAQQRSVDLFYGFFFGGEQ